MRSSNRPAGRVILALAAAALLGGCGNATVVSNVYSPYGGRYAYRDINYAASLGPLPVFVRGSPFAGDRGNLGVAAALQRHTSVPGLRFVPVADPATAGYRLVLAFGTFVPGVNYCGGRGDFPVSIPSSGRTEVAATFCLANYVHSQAQITGGPARDPADPNFDSMMGALINELFF